MNWLPALTSKENFYSSPAYNLSQYQHLKYNLTTLENINLAILDELLYLQKDLFYYNFNQLLKKYFLNDV